ncbi:MAG TPA: CopD family protein [Solirubrobacterales bacterium]|jgi:copper transport protein|nr:CopD family protein [Solirubrobacterales bacterium]
MRRSLPTILVCFLALLLPAAASAHARLEGTSPPEGAVVKAEPSAVIFEFDEPVEGNFGAVRVYDAAGERVDEGDAFHPNGEGPRLGVHLKPGLPDGSYTATYRVVSQDGHIVSSGYVFSIGKAGKAPMQTVGELIGGSGNGKVTEVAYGLARGLEYTAMALTVGGVAFLFFCWLPALGAASGVGEESRRTAAAAFAKRLRVVLWIGAGIGLVATAAQIVLEGAEAAGVSGFSAITKTIVEETLETRFGTVWGFALVAWIAIALLIPFVARSRVRPVLAKAPAGQPGSPDGPMDPRTNLPAVRERGGPWGHPLAALLIAVPLVYLCLCPALGGHGSSQSPVALDFTVNVIHVAAMATWLGGLATVLLVLPAATRSAAAPADRGRLLAGPLGRFSALALAMVALIMATGLIQAYVYVRHLGDLLSTGYGRAVLAKFLLLLAVIAIAAYNRQTVMPRLRRVAELGESPGLPGVLLRRALRGEVALLAVVIGVTAALASYAPPVSAQAGPFSTTTEVGPTTLEMDVDPARVGANQIHIYFFDAKTGVPYKAGKELTVTATLPDNEIGPLPLTVQSAGPGHYIVQSALLNAPGDWELGLALRVSEFDQFETKVEVPVR